MFLMYYPQLIEAGMVYKAVPPLYGTKEGNKQRYFTEQVDITKYIQKSFSSQYKITDMKNNALTPKQLTLLFMNNIDYLYFLRDVLADMFAVDPFLMEIVLYNYIQNKKKIDVKKLQTEVNKFFRFITVSVKNKIPMIVGTNTRIDSIDGTSENGLICRDKLFEDARQVIEILNSNQFLYYKVNGKKMSIYQIMTLYEQSQPKNIDRYKGLGEMNKDQLADSTLYPGSDRTLIQYTIDDLKDSMETVRDYESNPRKILSLVDNVTREDLME